MSANLRFQEACLRADAARAQMLDSATAARARVAPARLKQDVMDKAGDAVKNGLAQAAVQAQQRPFALGAAVAAFGLFLARRPLAALFTRLYVRISDTPPENSETDNG